MTTSFTVIAAEDGHTLAKVLRSRLHEKHPSWAQVKRWIEGRFVTLNEGICIDPARRIKEGDRIAVVEHPPKIPTAKVGIVIRHLDDHVVVAEKPSGMNTVRHPAELEWPEEKRRLDPTFQDAVQWAIAAKLKRPARSLPPLRIVHRLDRETSGLVVFARSLLAERSLGLQFRKHTVLRRYLAIVPGTLHSQTIESTLIRDRGDGRRGSTRQPDVTGKRAITHLEVVERMPTATMLACRLETGRTHQIRIHLSEAGHPVAGESIYVRTLSGMMLPKLSNAPRLCLHATELGFEHPTGGVLQWEMPLPADLERFAVSLRKSSK